MAEKTMYYTEEEATSKLGGLDQLNSFVEAQQLRVFHDGPKKMYRADQVDELAEQVASADTSVPTEAPAAAADDSAEIELVPGADTADGGAIGLADTDLGGVEVPSKEDTVITSEGMSIFDDEDLEVETDPMAKTGITQSMEDQISLEGAGSGSGLLDLTRESDDTSLGAEVLDHIDMEGALDTSLQGEPSGATASYAPSPDAPAALVEPQPAAVMAVVAAPADPSVGFFSGLLAGCCLVALVLGAIMLGGLRGIVPEFVETLNENLLIVLGAIAGVVVVSAIVGFLLGKSVATRQIAEIKPEGQ